MARRRTVAWDTQRIHAQHISPEICCKSLKYHTERFGLSSANYRGCDCLSESGLSALR
jgi:hypothetical protein